MIEEVHFLHKIFCNMVIEGSLRWFAKWQELCPLEMYLESDVGGEVGVGVVEGSKVGKVVGPEQFDATRGGSPDVVAERG